MKTVEDAVQQERGVWGDDEYNIMIWKSDDIDYANDRDPIDISYIEGDWQLVCTREQFEAEARRLGYRKELNPPTYTSGEDDPVNHPTHYTSGEIECIDAIRAALTPEEFRGFCKGNVIKYSWREKIKGGDQDLKKAAWYASKAVESTNG